jgi:hypothetical protein
MTSLHGVRLRIPQPHGLAYLGLQVHREQTSLEVNREGKRLNAKFLPRGPSEKNLHGDLYGNPGAAPSLAAASPRFGPLWFLPGFDFADRRH